LEVVVAITISTGMLLHVSAVTTQSSNASLSTNSSVVEQSQC